MPIFTRLLEFLYRIHYDVGVSFEHFKWFHFPQYFNIISIISDSIFVDLHFSNIDTVI